MQLLPAAKENIVLKLDLCIPHIKVSFLNQTRTSFEKHFVFQVLSDWNVKVVILKDLVDVNELKILIRQVLVDLFVAFAFFLICGILALPNLELHILQLRAVVAAPH